MYLSMRGTLTVRHQEILRPFILDRVVHDLGAGDLTLAHILVVCGAASVIAVDKQPMPEPRVPSIERVVSCFDAFTGPVDIAFMSWPVNWRVGLTPIARTARLVIYLGNNMGGSACGYPDLWWHLRSREVLAHEFESSGSLIVYGPGTRGRKGKLPEEHAALDHNRVWSYQELLVWNRERGWK